ncbi:MAG: endonuclease III [Planctomycetes bacterium]|nr:endonuclease III [Planctomycetota bacterium]
MARKKVARKTAKKPAVRKRRISPALRNRAARILWTLDETYPDSRCSLDHRSAFELLIATMLSAQCTDARVNIVTVDLFRRARTPRKLADVPIEELEVLVKSTGFFRNKAKNIKATSERIVGEFAGKVPRTMDELLSLPGVARKTANCVLGTAFDDPVGVVVDTHVTRIATLLGLTKEKDAVKIEKDLVELLPQDHWIRFTHQIIDHGRAVCIARRPQCQECALADECPSAKR